MKPSSEGAAPEARTDLLEPLDTDLGELLDSMRRHDAVDPTFGDDASARLLARVESAVREADAVRHTGPLRRISRIRPARAAAAVCLFALLAGAVVMKGRARDGAAPAVAPSAAPTPALPLREDGPARAERADKPAQPIATLHVEDLPSSTGPAPAASQAAGVRSVMPSASGSRLAEEVRIIEAARGASTSNDHAGALRLVREHERRFPEGQLVQERERIHIQVLLAAGNVAEARARADAFRARFPNGLLLPSVERSLAADTTGSR